MTRVLVTGASGFVGGHIVEACVAAGQRVRALVRPQSYLSHLRAIPEIELVHGELADAESLRAALGGIEVVHHAAARVADFGSRRDFVEANVAGTARLLDAARARGVRRFVFVSSPSVVMDGEDQLDIDERTPYPRRYLNLYSETKAEAERVVLAAAGPSLLTAAIRPRGVWGPRDRTGWLPTVLARMAARRMPDLSGGRRVLASVCYCESAARACVLAAKSELAGGRAYFVADAEPLDVWAFSETLAARFGVPRIERRLSPLALSLIVSAIELAWRLPALSHHRAPPLSRYSVALLTRSGTYDTRAAARDLGFRPEVSLEEGLDRTLAWARSIGGVEAFTRHVR